uniref:Uncharacterized protein n=1 Tax=Solanum lycopersicum TaxID=4081 RepID=A0A3Q7G5J8_SOLLC
MAERQGNEESLYQIQAKSLVRPISRREDEKKFLLALVGNIKRAASTRELIELGSDSAQNLYKVNGTVFKVIAEPTK